MTTTTPNEKPAATGRDTLVEIKNLRTYFKLAEGTVRAVDGVDLEVKRARTLGVVGESGCGKSMTAHSILRIVPAPGRIEEGEILYHKLVSREGLSAMTDTIDLAKLDPGGREIRGIRGNEISMVFQEPMTAMSPVRTVGRQIIEMIQAHDRVSRKQARARAIELLGLVGIPKPDRRVDEYPHQFSGGMQQRAMIAMALALNPLLLIADEPTTALDVTTEAQILDLMRDLQQELGMAIMYITHNLGVIAEMAAEVAVMYMGKIVEQADVNSIFFDPLHPYTRALLKSIPQLDDAVTDRGERRRLEVIEGMVPDPYAVLRGCSFHPRCPQAIADLCDRVEPESVEAKPGHLVKCHLYPPLEKP